MRNLHLLVAILWLSPLAAVLHADEYTAAEPSGTLTVKGDSTLHAWHATTHVIQGDITLTDHEISAMNVTIPVKALKSDKDGLDRKMHGAMKTDDFPSVTFLLKQSDVPEKLPEGMSGKVRMLTGDLTILSTTKSVTLAVTLNNDQAGNLVLMGSKDLTMTDFGVAPPKALLGTVKAKPEITVDFQWILHKSEAKK
jgi:polyisoprenoid-binding protein YceI